MLNHFSCVMAGLVHDKRGHDAGEVIRSHQNALTRAQDQRGRRFRGRPAACVVVSFASSPPSSAAAPAPVATSTAPSPMSATAAPSPMPAVAAPSPMLDRRDVVSRGRKIADNRAVDRYG